MDDIQTRRLWLRTPQMDDAQAVFEALDDLEVSRWLAKVCHPYSVADATDFIDKIHAGEIGRPGEVRFIFDSDGLCGCIGVENGLGYWIARRVWGRGYATEAARGILNWYFTGFQADEIASGHFTGNVASAKVLEKMGFSYSGNRDDITCLATGEAVKVERMIVSVEQFYQANPIIIQTERLTLRPIVDKDWEGLSTRCGVPEVAGTLLSIDLPWDEDRVKNWIQKTRWRGTATYRLAICLEGELIGAVGFAGTVGKFGFGYFLAPDYWGKGYGTEAARAFLRDAFARFDIPQMKSAALNRNVASHRILTKLGFEKTSEGMSPKTATLEPEPETRYRLTEPQFKAANP